MKWHRLTTDGRFKRDLAWSPQGDLLYFGLQQTPELLAIHQFDLATGQISRWHPQQNTSEFEPAFSADGRFAAWVQSRANLQLKLVIAPPNGSETAVFDPGGGFAGLRHPTWHPAGTQVCFSLPTAGGQQLITVDPQAKNRRDLTATAGINTHPAYSPTGDRLAFSSTRDGDYEIYVLQADGTNSRRLTHSPGMDLRPTWSGDGGRIAFVTNREGNYDLWLMGSDGSDPRPLTTHPERDDFPAWHPTDNRLACISVREGRHDIWLLELD